MFCFRQCARIARRMDRYRFGVLVWLVFLSACIIIWMTSISEDIGHGKVSREAHPLKTHCVEAAVVFRISDIQPVADRQ